MEERHGEDEGDEKRDGEEGTVRRREKEETGGERANTDARRKREK